MSVKGLTIKLLEGVTYNNPNVGPEKDGVIKGVSLSKGQVAEIPYSQVKRIQRELESGKLAIVGIIDDEMGEVGVPSKKEGDIKVTGPAAAKKELEHELKHGIKSEPDSIVKVREDRFNPGSPERFVESKEGETHEETQSRIRDEMNGKTSKSMKDEVAQVSSKKAAQVASQQSGEKPRNATQEMRDEMQQELNQGEGTEDGEGTTESNETSSGEEKSKEPVSTGAPASGDAAGSDVGW